MEKLQKMISEKSVVIFSKNSCCMSHTIKTLFLDFGVNPTIYELDEINKGKEIEQALSQLGCSPTVPVVFIGGQLVGGANQVMTSSQSFSRPNAETRWSIMALIKYKGYLRKTWFDN